MAEMQWWEVAGWGLFGSLLVDALEIYKVVRNNGGRWPEDCRTPAFCIAEFFRIGIGTGLALAFWRSGQIEGAMGILTVGASAPLIVEKLSRNLPRFSEPYGVVEPDFEEKP